MGELTRAQAFSELLAAAVQRGLGRELEGPFADLLEGSARRWVLDAIAMIDDELGSPTLRGFLERGDAFLAGRDQRSLRKAILELAAAHLEQRPRAPQLQLVKLAADAPVPDQRPRNMPELVRWANANGIGDLVGVHAAEAFREDLAMLRRLHALGLSYGTVGGLALVQSPQTRAGALSPSEREELSTLAWRYLEDGAARVATLREAEQRALSSPLPAVLAPALLDLLSALRDRWRALRQRIPLGLGSQAPEGRLEIEDGAAPRVAHVLASSTRTTVSMARLDPLVLEWSCTCGSLSGCGGEIALARRLEGAILSGNEPALVDALVRVLTVPAWKRGLEHLDRMLTSAPDDDAPEGVVWWHLTGRGEALRLQAFVQSEGKRGPKRPKRTSPQKLLAQRLTPGDREIAELLQLHERALRYDPETADILMERALRRLTGHPRVCLGDEPSAAPEPIAVEAGKLEIAAVGEQGAVRLRPSLDGTSLTHAELARARDRDAVGGLLVRAFPEEKRCVITPLDPRTIRALSTLEAFDTPIPLSERAELVRRLPALERIAPIRFEGSLPRREVPAEETIVVRLSPAGGAALAVQVYLRPIPGGLLVLPGEPPAEVVAATDARELIFARRDLDAERARVSARLAPVLPGLGGAGQAWSAEIAELDAALDVVAKLERERDIEVEWPAGDPWRVVGTATSRHLRVEIQDRGDWFGLGGGLSLDGHRVDLAVLLEAARARRRFVRLEGGSWLAVSEELRQGLDRVEPMVFAGRSGLEVSDLAAGEIHALAPESERPVRWRSVLERIERAKAIEPTVPAELRAELRPYQAAGHAWMMRLAEWGVGGCLADDMGLGKTVQALAVLVDRAPRGPALVVAPTSVTYNWAREAERFAPGLRPLLYRGADRAGMLESVGPSDLLIASYALLQRDQAAFAGVRFATLVVDEAQQVKNPSSRRAHAVRAIDAEWRMALTGTPVENHLGELWSLFRVIAPGLLGSWEHFRERFAGPIERGKDPHRAKVLSRLIRPFVLRRTKQEVARELPPRTEVEVDVELSKAERDLYEDARLAAVAKLAALGPTSHAEDQRFHVLAAITRLRMLASNPRLADPGSNVPSSKLGRLLELVNDLVEEGQRALVFSQFTSHLALVREALVREGIEHAYLDGSTPAGQREAIVDAFQNGRAPVFLISLKAGGTGLNLTAADNVIHLDPWWNPAAEDQATDRAHRIGQTRPVTVYRLIARGTIEDAILKLHAEKRALVAGVLEGTGQAAGVTTRELLEMIEAGVAWTDPSDGAEVSDDPVAGVVLRRMSTGGTTAAPG